MKFHERQVHPYIPNSAPATKAAMMKEIGIEDIDELYEDIPSHLRFKGEMNLPKALTSELALKRHMDGILGKNVSVDEKISFLGGGCSNHYVPAIVDEVINRSEFLTAYAGEPYEDHGRFQVLFEYQSLMAELLDFDVVNVPTYDWGQAAATSIRMAERITGRGTVLVADTISPDRLSIIRNYCHPVMQVVLVGHDNTSGQIDMGSLKGNLSGDVAALYFENPAYTGVLEENGQVIADELHANGSLMIVGLDPLSASVIKPPSQYGADIACGDIQSLGNHMHFGGTLAGFIATRDEERFVMEYPSRLFGIAKTSVEGEWGFSDVAYDRTSFGVREKGKEFVGTAAALWGISSAVYLSLLGPQGITELGQTIIQRSLYTQKRLSELKGVKLRFTSATFKECVVDFSGTGKTVVEINKLLLEKGIFGGKDLTEEMPGLPQCALYAVTEMHGQAEIDALAAALKSVLA
ncbi:aminomethyl-transferring glycine dehydrogenase subunit GcvPA [bacterium]|nr:aminomethyl-transferring glycine dehydrogenase subunit GcvPA [bacterium]